MYIYIHIYIYIYTRHTEWLSLTEARWEDGHKS